MKDVIIKIYKDSSVYTENGTLGINYENIQGKLVFEFVDEFVDGTAYLEFERKFEKGLIPMNKVGKTYEIEIKSSLLKEIGNIDLQLRITQDEVPNGIPVYKSKVFTLEVLDAINATSEIPDEYPEWIDLANEKIKEMDNLNVTTERVEDGVDIVLTDKKGNTTRTEVKDGAPGPVGPQGEPGAVKMQVVDTLPETGRTDTIYLVKKDNPGEQNLYDEYVYTETGWEHIGDTSVDLSDYYTKEESNEKLLAKQDKLVAGENITISEDNVISATFQKEIIELTDETIVLKDLEVGIYRITKSVVYIRVGKTNYSTAGYWNCLMLVDYYKNAIKRGYVFSEGKVWCFTDKDYGHIGKSIKDIMTTSDSQTIVATHTYNILPKSTVVPVQDNQFTNKKYVDDAVATKQDILTYSMYLPDWTNVTDTEKLQVASDLINNLYKSGSNNSFILHNLHSDIFTGDSYDSNMFMNGAYPITKTKGTFKFMSINNSTKNTAEPCIRGHILYIYGTWTDDVFAANRMLLTRLTHDLSLSNLNSSFLNRNNTTSYTPTADYNPSTKLYTDKTHYENMTGYDATKTQVLKNINGTLTWVNE